MVDLTYRSEHKSPDFVKCEELEVGKYYHLYYPCMTRRVNMMGTYVINEKGDIFCHGMSNLNYWDIRTMLREVAERNNYIFKEAPAPQSLIPLPN